jgi:hypothetical protein
MRRWLIPLLVLVACGGKIAAEEVGGSSGRTGDDDDDVVVGRRPGSVSSTSGYGGSTSSGYYGTSGYYGGTTSGDYGTSGYASSGYPYPVTDGGYYPGTSSSASGSVPGCSNVFITCGGDGRFIGCDVSGGYTQMNCSYDTQSGTKYATCSCFRGGADAIAPFSVDVSTLGRADSTVLLAYWQKYCGGYCY